MTECVHFSTVLLSENTWVFFFVVNETNKKSVPFSSKHYLALSEVNYSNQAEMEQKWNEDAHLCVAYVCLIKQQ